MFHHSPSNNPNVQEKYIRHEEKPFSYFGCIQSSRNQLEESSCNSFNPSLKYELKNEKDRNIVKMKLLELINSNIKYLEEEEMKTNSKQLTKKTIYPQCDFEFGLTDKELQSYRHIKDLKWSVFQSEFFSADYLGKARELFEYANSNIDMAFLSAEILKFPNVLDQDYLLQQISFKVASHDLFRKNTNNVWNSLDSPLRRQKIEHFCNFEPSRNTDSNVMAGQIRIGIYTRAVIAAIRNPNWFIQMSILRIGNTLGRLQSFEEEMKIE